MADQKPVIEFSVNRTQVQVSDNGDTLLGVLRNGLGLTGAKDGCSPQGQCGCCTVLVDGQPRVACVTPARRVRGREVTTIEGLTEQQRAEWGEAFCASGGSQCGFCTPGIIMRFEGLAAKGVGVEDLDSVNQGLLAHMCRCTGWQTITEAWVRRYSTTPANGEARDLDAAARRAEIEGGAVQLVNPRMALGLGGFSADTAPSDALIAVADADEVWHVGETLAEARAAAGKVQGRRTTVDPSWPIELPAGDWVSTLQTTWVEPAYLETDATWCEPGGQPTSPLANGGAFGAKMDSFVATAAQRLAEEHQRAVLAMASREDTVRLGPKRPPVAGGIRADGTGVLRVGHNGPIPPATLAAVGAVAPGLVIEIHPVAGPPTSTSLRAAVWAEAFVLASAIASVPPTSPSGATATAQLTDDSLVVTVGCGEVLDETVLRSYCIGAAHMALGWVTSEALAVDEHGEVHDLTVRSFGILRAVDTPLIDVNIVAGEGPAVNGSDAVFAAVAAAAAQRLSPNGSYRWPTGAMINP